MGNYLYLSRTLFQATQRINDGAFDYYKKENVSKNDETLFEIETDEFTNVTDIRQKLQSLSSSALVTSLIDTDILPALQYYLNPDCPYSNKALLAQTDYFIFKKRIPLLSIKNTNAAANRSASAIANGAIANATQTGIFVASCDLNALWNRVE